MSKIGEALEFLKQDTKKAIAQWREGKPFESLLQREDVSFEDLMSTFDPAEDEADWSSEYKGKNRSNKSQLYRKRIAFMTASRKEFREEYDPDRTDVDLIRLMEVPYADAKYVIDFSISELGD